MNEFRINRADKWKKVGDFLQPRDSNLDVNISKVDPEIRLTDTGNNQFSRITKSDTLNLAQRFNKVAGVGNVYSLEFDGGDDRVSVMGTDLIPNAGSMSFWFNPAWSGNDGVFSNNYQNNTNDKAFRFERAISGVASIILANDVGGDVSSMSTTTNFNNGTWYHVLFTWNQSASRRRLYVNGVSEDGGGTGDNVFSLPTDFDNFMLAGSFRTSDDRDYSGKLDETALWSRELEASDAVDLYTSGNGLFIDGTQNFNTSGTSMGLNLLAVWHFNDGSGTTLTDSSGNGKDGTLLGMTNADWVAGKVALSAVEVNVWKSTDTGYLFGDDTLHTSFEGSAFGFNNTSPTAFLDAVIPLNTQIGFNLKGAVSQLTDYVNIVESDDNPLVIVDSSGNFGVGAIPIRKGHFSCVTEVDHCFLKVEGGVGKEAVLELHADNNDAGDRWRIAAANGTRLWFRNNGVNKIAMVGGSGNLEMRLDNQKILWGAGQDASIYYDGTNMIFNSAEVGSGTSLFENGVPTSIPLTIKLAVNQSANGWSITNSSDTELTFAGPDGKLYSDLGTDSSNVFFGGGGNSTMTGDENILIGEFAGDSITSGLRNLCIGASAGTALTESSNNFALGAFALSSMTNQTGNTVMIGTLAGQLVTGGTNVGIGHNAMRKQTIGTGNVAIGSGSMTGATGAIGFQNVAIGDSTLLSITSLNAQRNVAIGFQAGRLIESGDNNTLIGFQAGDLLTTGGNNIIIGSSQDPTGATVSNQLNIGGVIYSGDITIGNIGIGILPTEKLHVDGHALFDTSHGELYENNAISGTDITIITAGTYVQWTSTTVGSTSGTNYVVGSVSTDNLVIGNKGAGDYNINFKADAASIPGLCNQWAVFKNGVKTHIEGRATTPQFAAINPESVNLVTGVLNSGSVADVDVKNSIYYNVQEVSGTPGFDIRFTFIDPSELANLIQFSGRYAGNVNHAVEIQVYNNTTTNWDNVLATIKDLYDSDFIDYDRNFLITGTLSDYYNANSEIIVRIYHATTGSTADNIFIDKFHIAQETSVTNVSGTGILQGLVDTDIVDLRVTCNVSGAVFETKHINLNIKRINR